MIARDYSQAALDCAVVRQAVADLQTWNHPPTEPNKNGQIDWPDSEAFRAFGDAARWVFDGIANAAWLFSFETVCERLSIDVRKARRAIREQLTPHQRAWMTALGIEMEAR